MGLLHDMRQRRRSKECHTCVHVCHVECNRNIPMNYADKIVRWRCSNCEEEDGKTQCMYMKCKPTNKREKIEELTGTEKIYNDKRGGRTTGRVVDIPNNITQFIEMNSKEK